MVEQQGNPDGEQWGLCALMVVGGSMQLLVARETTQLAGSSGSQQYLGGGRVLVWGVVVKRWR